MTSVGSTPLHPTCGAAPVAGDPVMPMTREQVTDKFRRYVEPMLGERRTEALIRFVLDGEPDQPARTCFTLAG